MIVKKLRELRKTRGMTAKQLGAILNVAESTISLYENGKRAPDYEMLKKISAYFGVSVDYLLDNDKKEEPAAYDELHSDPPYLKKSTPWLPALSDPQDREFLELYSELTPEERQFVLAAIKGMLSK